MQIKRQLTADTTVAKEAGVHPRGSDGTDVGQGSAEDMDADDAVVYPDGTNGIQWRVV